MSAIDFTAQAITKGNPFEADTVEEHLWEEWSRAYSSALSYEYEAASLQRSADKAIQRAERFRAALQSLTALETIAAEVAP